MSERQRPMPEVNPIMFFGSWCGPGWSAGRKSEQPLTREDRRVGGKLMAAPSGNIRPSPVDLTCKSHDERYDAAYLTEDPLKRAQMIMSADLALLDAVTKLHASIILGRIELSLYEIFFSNNMKIAFKAKLITNAQTIASLRTERAIGPRATNMIRSVMPTTMIVLGLPPIPKKDGVPRRAVPAHRSQPTVIRIDSDLALATALSNVGRQEPVDYLSPKQPD